MIDLKLKWEKDNFEREKGEFQRVIREHRLTSKERELISEFRTKYNEADPISIDKKIWDSLENTDSHIGSIRNAESLRRIIFQYKSPLEIIRLNKQFIIDRKIHCPIILQKGDGSFTLVGGNTRLCFCAYYINKLDPVYYINRIGDVKIILIKTNLNMA